MLNKKVNTYMFLVTSLFSLALGFLFIFLGPFTISLLITIMGIGFIIQGLFHFLWGIFNKEKKKKIVDVFVKSLFDIGFGIFVIFANNAIMISMSLLFGIYILIICITHILNYYIYRHYHISGRLMIIIKFLINFIFALVLLSHPKLHIQYLGLVVGCYLILYGITSFTDFLTEIIPKRTKNKIWKNLSIQLPILITAFIPQRLIKTIHQLLEEEGSTASFDYQKTEASSDIQVLIHLAHGGTAMMGHVEIAYQGKVYSYGNYNMHSRMLFQAVGDGIVLIADKMPYIEYCIMKHNRYIIEFGITLTEEEKEVVQNKIEELLTTNTIDYYPDQAKSDKGELEAKEYHDMSSEIYRLANGKYKKIIKGKHKKFFVLKMNCAMVAQYILSSLGKEVIAINGILSPGAYYDYLNNRFMMKNTNVISRKAYTKQNFRK